MWLWTIGPSTISSSIFITYSSYKGKPNNIFICLIFYVSWDPFNNIYFTRSTTALWLFWNIWDPTDHLPFPGELLYRFEDYFKYWEICNEFRAVLINSAWDF